MDKLDEKFINFVLENIFFAKHGYLVHTQHFDMTHDESIKAIFAERIREDHALHGRFVHEPIEAAYVTYQSRQAEVDQAYADIETFAQAFERECEFKDQFAQDLKEKDKRIEEVIELLNKCNSYGYEQCVALALRTLRGEL